MEEVVFKLRLNEDIELMKVKSWAEGATNISAWQGWGEKWTYSDIFGSQS